jgi:glycine oxidase
MVILPEEGALDPAEALGALAHALTDRGGSVRRRAHVIEAHSGGVTLADGTRLAADIVVLAPGAWGANLAAPLGQLEPMKGQLAEVDSNALAPGETLRGPGVYAVGRAPGRVVIGATMEPGRVDLGTDVEAIADMMERAEALSHALHNVKLVRSWAGVRPMNPDWAPRITRSDGVILAYGHSRNGWLLAPVTAEIVAALALGDEIKPLWAEFGA